jgi:hypothetical protein
MWPYAPAIGGASICGSGTGFDDSPLKHNLHIKINYTLINATDK